MLQHFQALNYVKPPNILIYEEGGDTFDRFKLLLSSLLKPNLYVIYKLSDKDLRTRTWHESTVLVVICKPPLGKESYSSLMHYFHSHRGKIWTASSSPWTSKLMKYFGDSAIGCENSAFVVQDPFFSSKNIELSDFLRIKFNLQVQEADLELPLSSEFGRDLLLMGKNLSHVNSFLSERIKDDQTLIQNSKNTITMKPSLNGNNIMIHIKTHDWTQNPVQSTTDFDCRKFYELLKTKELGNLIIYGKEMRSTFDVTDNVQIKHGLFVIADRQTSGKGRGGNQWLSPKGCAMFTLQIHILLRSLLGSKLSIIQHLIGVATVEGLRKLRKDVDVRLKWPNDIYYGSSLKLGGILVNSSISGEVATIDIGLGLNLDNDVPMISLNRILESHGLQPISREEFFAELLNSLEIIIEKVQSNDLNSVMNLYYQYWLHGAQNVQLMNSNTELKEKGIIRHLDQYGFLIVETEKSYKISVHPDGNSFDMVKGLIIPKSQR
ncbi:biotin--protein ligase [Lepeophtheirus salmonis]|uniref:biotin--protein ligase n=1 Tax=Lepeophtheirus salmonis TaxID=72036 RepID=UPI001AE78DD7|nr:biotin--protein ligase-like [Lepeophtheirus salmonis]